MPGVVATRDGQTRIVEIETNRDDDHPQHKAFRKYANRHGNDTSFYGRIVNLAGDRVEKFE